MRRRSALVAVVVLGLTLVGCGSDSSDEVSPAAAQIPIISDLLAPKAPAAPPPPPRQLVAPAPPTGFVMTGPAFTINAAVCQMENVRPLDPPGDQKQTVCWVREGFGVAPGSASGGTSYILGHAWAREKLVFNPLSELVMAEIDESKPVLENGVPTFPAQGLNGYDITLRTPNGTLAYKVTRAFAVAKDKAADVATVMDEGIPDRITLITCGVRDGKDIEVNVIVDAYLVSSVAN